jgi:hypothetical protein
MRNGATGIFVTNAIGIARLQANRTDAEPNAFQVVDVPPVTVSVRAQGPVVAPDMTGFLDYPGVGSSAVAAASLDDAAPAATESPWRRSRAAGRRRRGGAILEAGQQFSPSGVFPNPDDGPARSDLARRLLQGLRGLVERIPVGPDPLDQIARLLPRNTVLAGETGGFVPDAGIASAHAFRA